MPTYTFSCPDCGYRWDQRVAFDTRNHPCPNCPWLGYRESVYRVSVAGFAETPNDQRTYYQEYKDFREAGAELEYHHSRMEEAAGKPLPTPPLAKTAIRRAKALQAAGVKDSADYKSRLKH